MILRAVWNDMTDHLDSADMADPIEPADPIENADAIEPTDPIDKTLPTDPIESTEPFDPIDSTEFSDHNDRRLVDRLEARIAPVSRWRRAATTAPASSADDVPHSLTCR